MCPRGCCARSRTAPSSEWRTPAWAARWITPVISRRWRGERAHPRAVGDVELGEGEAGIACEPRQPGALERRIVVAVDVVDADHPLATAEQSEADVVADEAGAAGDHDRHASPSSSSRPTLSGLPRRPSHPRPARARNRHQDAMNKRLTRGTDADPPRVLASGGPQPGHAGSLLRCGSARRGSRARLP